MNLAEFREILVALQDERGHPFFIIPVPVLFLLQLVLQFLLDNESDSANASAFFFSSETRVMSSLWEAMFCVSASSAVFFSARRRDTDARLLLRGLLGGSECCDFG